MSNLSQIEASKSVVPREAVATPADVQKLLELSEEKISELKRERDLELYRSRARLSIKERNVGRGIELEQHYRVVGDSNGLAEALALQGRYKEAAECAVCPVIKAECEAKIKAVELPDEDCKCDPFREENGYLIPNQHIESYGYSEKHQKQMPFIRCSVCGTLNAMQPPKHLIEQREVRHSQEVSDSERLKFFKK